MTSLSPSRPAARIPGPSVARLASYLTALRDRAANGVTVVSSAELAEVAGVNPLILRKDLSYVGGHGVRGVGYQVHKLIATVAMAISCHMTSASVWIAPLINRVRSYAGTICTPSGSPGWSS